jgi:glycosyltransferase involved in cell wall biosynthesis
MAPARGGNGLAMRIAQFVDAASWDFDVVVAVVPVTGVSPAIGGVSVPTALVGDFQLEPVGAAMASLLTDPQWRGRVAAAALFPHAARAAPPTMARQVCRAAGQLGELAGTPVHVVRSYLAPLGLAVAEQLSAPWATLDLDDDDEALRAENGDMDEATAYRRLIATFGPSFAGLAAASVDDADALHRRHGLDVTVLPNNVQLPTGPAGAAGRTPDLLFVGNLTYPPNVSAKTLVEELLPAVRRRSGLPVTATVVGNYGGNETIARLAAHPGVRVLGFVDDLQPLYDRASVAVVPLRTGSGTKIKLLEAFAQRLPVVTTPAGAAGLGVVRGRHLLVGEDEAELVSQIARLLAYPAAAHRLAEAAFEYVRAHHTPESVLPIVHAFLRAAGERAQPEL